MNLSSYRKYAKSLCIILLAILVSLYVFRHDTGEFVRVIERHEKLSIILSLVIYTLLGATLVPSELLTVFLINLYGPLVTVLVATVGNTLAAFMEFFVGGSVGDLAEFEKRKAKLPIFLREIPIASPVFILLARMLPGIGPKFVSLACGIYKVPLRTYTWTTLVSNLMGAIVIVSGGYRLLKLL